jgi:hypothetical protein
VASLTLLDKSSDEKKMHRKNMLKNIQNNKNCLLISIDKFLKIHLQKSGAIFISVFFQEWDFML